MAVTKIGVDEAKRLVAEQTTYLDVRTVPEFENGHVPGAYNIPLLHDAPGGMQPNPNFEREVESALPKDAPVVVACKAGVRSARAAAMLEKLGYSTIYDFVGGWGGNDSDPGWAAAGGPSTREAEPGRSYRDLKG